MTKHNSERASSPDRAEELAREILVQARAELMGEYPSSLAIYADPKADFEAKIKWLAALLRSRMAERWIPVSERIPEFEEPVWGLLRLENGGWCTAIVMRGDGEDGWLWHICNEWAGNMVQWPLNQDADFECDDDYRVEYWLPLTALPSAPDTEKA